jgi:ABC-2 type transport system ATP-binding protein
VAEGTPTALKAEIGRPSVHAIPAVADDRVRILALLDRFGEPLGDGELAVRLDEGVGLADVVRGIDAEGLALHDVELRAPTLDDVFLAKTGRTLEGAAEEDEEPAAARRR